MTLIEILLAVLIAGLILGVVYTLYHTVTTAALGRRVRDDEISRAGRALETISRDLTTLFAAPADECRLRLGTAQGGDKSSVELSFCALRCPEGETDPRWLEACRVRYGVDRSSDPEGVLRRVVRPLVGPGSGREETNELIRGVARFQVSLFDGAEWKTEWEEKPETKPPRAARVDLELTRLPRTFSTEILIPVGLVFTSRLERATTEP